MPAVIASVLLAAFLGGIAISDLFYFSWYVVAFLAVINILFFSFWLVKRSRVGLAGFFILLVFTIGLVRSELAPRTPPPVFQLLFDSKVVLEGNVVGDPDVREATTRTTIAVEYEGSSTRVIIVTPKYPELRSGDRVQIEGKLERPEPFATDGGRTFRYDDFLAKDGIFGIINFAKVDVLEQSHGIDRLFAYLYDAKHAFDGALALSIPEPYASLGSGILTGGKQGLGEDLLDAFTVAGLLPIVVLSGYNIMIIAEATLKGLRFTPKRVAATVAAIVILLFIIAAGSGGSAVRAGLMAGIGLYARASGRTYDALRALVLVLVVMLLINPLLLVHDPGFQFSFVATVGLIIGTPILEPYFARIRNAFLRDIIASTIAAQLFVLPLLLYQTGNFSLVALPANVLVLPVIPLAMLASAIAGAITLIIPSLALIVGLPAFALLWYVVSVAEISAALPLASIVIPAFPFVVVPVLYGALALLMRHLKRNAPAADVAGARMVRELPIT